MTTTPSGILLVDKKRGSTSFGIVAELRKISKEKRIGHAGTLDPFATGVMILLIGSRFTKKAELFTGMDKSYEAIVRLGAQTDSYDCDGTILQTCDKIPSLSEVEAAIQKFQGTIEQTPPMFSAKKIGGKKLYEYARKGISIERKPCLVKVETQLISYNYPDLHLSIDCSKGTYIRSIANDLGNLLGSFAFLHTLRRTRVGPVSIENCFPQEKIDATNLPTLLRDDL